MTEERAKFGHFLCAELQNLEGSFDDVVPLDCVPESLSDHVYQNMYDSKHVFKSELLGANR